MDSSNHSLTDPSKKVLEEITEVVENFVGCCEGLNCLYKIYYIIVLKEVSDCPSLFLVHKVSDTWLDFVRTYHPNDVSRFVRENEDFVHIIYEKTKDSNYIASTFYQMLTEFIQNNEPGMYCECSLPPLM